MAFTKLKVAELLANNIGIIDRPSIVTDGAPCFIDTDFHSTLQTCCAPLESNSTLLTELWSLSTLQSLYILCLNLDISLVGMQSTPASSLCAQLWIGENGQSISLRSLPVHPGSSMLIGPLP